MKLMLVTLALVVTGQAGPPPELDAVAVAPGNHRIVLENERVRVLQVEVAPGETEPIHEHRWPSVLHVQTAQPAIDISYAYRDGKMIETGRRSIPAGTPPPALWVPRQGPHAVKNLGLSPFRLIRIELKDPT